MPVVSNQKAPPLLKYLPCVLWLSSLNYLLHCPPTTSGGTALFCLYHYAFMRHAQMQSTYLILSIIDPFHALWCFIITLLQAQVITLTLIQYVFLLPIEYSNIKNWKIGEPTSHKPRRCLSYCSCDLRVKPVLSVNNSWSHWWITQAPQKIRR